MVVFKLKMAEVRRGESWWSAAVVILAALMPAVFMADMLMGAYKVSVTDVIGALTGLFPVPRNVALVIWQLRVPQALASLILGASLASAGAVLQVILRNPLASTYTLGVSAAAGFGAALAIIMGAGYVSRYYSITLPYLVILSAFVMASIASIFVYVLSFIKGASPLSLILAGVAVMFIFSTGTSLLQYLSGNPDATHAVVMWMLGSVANVALSYVPYMALSLLAIPYYLIMGWRLNSLNLGDDVAHSLGVDVKRLRLTTMLVAAFQAAATISFVGLVGFVDLVTPNIARILVGNDVRRVLVVSALMGADITLIADLVSKAAMPPYVLPIGVVLALIGAPYLLGLVLVKGVGHAE